MAASAGLTQAEARRRLAAQGPNRLPGGGRRSLWTLGREVLSEPMLLLLLGAGGVYVALGDRAEAALMMGAVVAVAALAFIQEVRTVRALEALRELSAPLARVLREGEVRSISSHEVVVGDLLLLQEGDRVPADGELVEGLLSVDESLLTGESVAVVRAMGGDVQVLAGTLVVTGMARAEVTATGAATAMGRLGKVLAAQEAGPSPLQQASAQVVRRIATGGLSLAVAAGLLGWAWAGRAPLESLLQGLTLAMAILPEEIPVVLAVFLAMGAFRISRHRVLTRRIAAVEALGSITVLAVDKTGTLTQNRMAVAELRAGDRTFEAGTSGELPEAFHLLVEMAVLASPQSPFDPMELALQAFADRHLTGTEHLHADWRSARVYELSPDILAVTRAYPEGGGYLLAAKGAPEAIADLCHLPEAELAAVRIEARDMAGRGLRVLGVACGRYPSEPWPEHQHAFDYGFLGLVGLADPPRPEAKAAVAACQGAGIRVLMLTGDHPETARAIARQVGLRAEGPILTGPELEALDDLALGEALSRTCLCARVRPEQKLRLVAALRARGEVVAMTGDGVNDAPALAAAHVGVAMGARGTEVAREAAALVLVDDSIGALEEAIAEGRRIYGNLVHSVGFIMAVHVPVVLLTFLALVLKWPPLLMPAHIVLMELIIDPACSIVLEAEPAPGDLMARPPRAPGDSPFRARVLGGGLLQGAGVAVLLAALAWVGHRAGWPLPGLRSAVVGTLAISAFLLVLAHRDPSRPMLAGLRANRLILVQGAVMAVAAGAVALLPAFRRLMVLGALPPGALAAMGATLLAVIGWLEGWRRIARRW